MSVEFQRSLFREIEETVAATRMSAEDRNAQLLDIAEELFTTQGYDQVSIEDVARAAGITRPIVYQHHGSKEGLILACARRARQEFEASLYQAHLSSGGDLATFVERGGHLLFDLLRERPSRWALLFSGSVGENHQLAQELATLRHGTVDRIAELAGEYAPGLDQQQLCAFAHAVSGISEAYCRWSLRSPEIPVEQILTYYRDFITSAIKAALERGGSG